MTYNVFSGTLNPTHSLFSYQQFIELHLVLVLALQSRHRGMTAASLKSLAVNDETFIVHCQTSTKNLETY